MARSYRRWADTIVGDDSHRWDNFLPYFKKSLQFTLPDATKLTANATAEHDPASLGDNNGPLSVTFSSYVQAIACLLGAESNVWIGIRPVEGPTGGELLGSSVRHASDSGQDANESSETAFLQPTLQRTNLVVRSQSLAKRIFSHEVLTVCPSNQTSRTNRIKCLVDQIISVPLLKQIGPLDLTNWSD